MKEFEKLCNEYRENKRLIEELEAMHTPKKPATSVLQSLNKGEK